MFYLGIILDLQTECDDNTENPHVFYSQLLILAFCIATVHLLNQEIKWYISVSEELNLIQISPFFFLLISSLFQESKSRYHVALGVFLSCLNFQVLFLFCLAEDVAVPPCAFLVGKETSWLFVEGIWISPISC